VGVVQLSKVKSRQRLVLWSHWVVLVFQYFSDYCWCHPNQREVYNREKQKHIATRRLKPLDFISTFGSSILEEVYSDDLIVDGTLEFRSPDEISENETTGITVSGEGESIAQFKINVTFTLFFECFCKYRFGYNFGNFGIQGWNLPTHR